MKGASDVQGSWDKTQEEFTPFYSHKKMEDADFEWPKKPQQQNLHESN